MLRRHSVHTIDERPEVDVLERDDVERRDVDRPVVGREPGVDGRGDEQRLVVDDRPLPPPVARTIQPAPVFTDRTSSDSTVSRQSFSVAAVLGAIAGLALLVIGIIALLRGGLDGPIDEPVVSVMGFTHTPLLGLVEIAFGLLLLASAATASRSALTFLGLVAIVAGAVAIAEPEQLADRFAVERSLGWAWVIGGAAVAVAAWLFPVYERETRRVRHTTPTV